MVNRDGWRLRLEGVRCALIDLDDTLHDFSHASGLAMSAVYAEICRTAPQIQASELARQYREALHNSNHSFVDGRRAIDYRTERFSALLRACAVPLDCVDELVACYGRSFERALRLEPGAGALLQACRGRGYTIVVVSEGPRDAQLQTVANLGLAAAIDGLVTSNDQRCTKPDGLYARAAARVEIPLSDCLVIGDSVERDIEPVWQSAAVTVHYTAHSATQARHADLCVSSLYGIQELLV